MLSRKKPLKQGGRTLKPSYLKSRKTPRKLPKSSVSKLKKKADTYWSIYIRLRDSDGGGVGACISCGVRKPWKQLQNGHFVSRSSSTLRFDEENCNAQCVGCNMFKQGNQYSYGLALDDKYGDGTAAKLWAQRNETHKFTVQELEEIIHDAKELIKSYGNDTDTR